MVSFSNIESIINRIHVGSTPEWFENIPDEIIALTITSPPYYDSDLYILDNGELEFGWKSYEDYIMHLKNTLERLYAITIPGGRLALVVSNTPQLDDNDTVEHYWPISHDINNCATKIGWKLMDEIIWKKEMSNYDDLLPKQVPETQLQQNHDTISILRKPGPKRVTTKTMKVPSIWEFPSEGPIKRYNKMYPSFPNGLVQKIIELWSLPNDIILDPYAGSGQVIRIAMNNDRFAIGIEVDDRWSDLWDDINT